MKKAESPVSKLRNQFESCVSEQKILFNFEVPGDRDFKGREWQPGPQEAVAGRTPRRLKMGV